MVNTDQPNQLGKENYPGFRENRHDQTALSLAAFREGIIGHRGFSDSSEYGIFEKRLKDFGCFGYSDNELRKMAYDEYISQGFMQSDYKRIIVNCRARDQRLLPFTKTFLRSVKWAYIIDRRRDADVQRIIKEIRRGGKSILCSCRLKGVSEVCLIN